MIFSSGYWSGVENDFLHSSIPKPTLNSPNFPYRPDAKGLFHSGQYLYPTGMPTFPHLPAHGQ